MRNCIVLVLWIGCSVAMAEEATSKPSPTTATTEPVSKAGGVKSIADATERYQGSMRKAREVYLRDLQELKRRATKAGNLEQANEVTTVIARVEQERSLAGGSSGKATRLNVQANADWQRTSVAVKKGDVLHVRASGEWCVTDQAIAEQTYGPDGLRRDQSADWHGQFALLMARVGFKVYPIGKEATFTADQDGVLEFRSNDFSLGDNRGELAVSVVKN